MIFVFYKTFQAMKLLILVSNIVAAACLQIRDGDLELRNHKDGMVKVPRAPHALTNNVDDATATIDAIGGPLLNPAIREVTVCMDYFPILVAVVLYVTYLAPLFL